ncbi:uncharacterized protein LOC128208790 [Mya arenaria]|uniref:uncharacterized protein LOC128208790 n=1 Tax=Mya arenaria TaxID=6604 RepID=UPI0022E6874A|nr:uncharacterized protein LOC128208790 [Mya arenaria]
MTTEGNMGQGIKRKMDVLEIDKLPQNQRQCIVDISVTKLQVNKSERKVEPSLLRSVLILNTLKHIETELKKEGLCPNSNTSAMDIPEVNPNSTAIDFLPEVPSNSKPADVPVVAEQFGPLPSIDTFVGNRAVQAQDRTENSPFSIVTEAALTTIYPSSLRMEEVFNDLDFNIADYDVFSAVGTNKLTPLSAEEVIHSCPSSPPAFATDTFTTLANASLSPYCKSDSAFEDLENIMQILVGS